jgi:Ca2+-binding EF-hand superfamily protein
MQRPAWMTALCPILAPLVLSLAASSLEAQENKPLTHDDRLFARIDANGDGQISAEEINSEGKPLYARLLRIADENGDRSLTKDEFEKGLKGGPGRFELSAGAASGGPDAARDMMANLNQAFVNLDRDKNGKVSESEAPPRLKQNFARFDKDGDGQLDRRELGAALMARPGNAPVNAGRLRRPDQRNGQPQPTQPQPTAPKRKN